LTGFFAACGLMGALLYLAGEFLNKTIWSKHVVKSRID